MSTLHCVIDEDDGEKKKDPKLADDDEQSPEQTNVFADVHKVELHQTDKSEAKITRKLVDPNLSRISQLKQKSSQESSSLDDKSQATVICHQNGDNSDLQNNKSVCDNSNSDTLTSDKVSMSSADNQCVLDSITESMYSFESLNIDSCSIQNCTVDIYSEDIEYIDE